MLQITCKCGREMELIHPTQSGMVICSGCLAQVSVPEKGGAKRDADSGPPVGRVGDLPEMPELFSRAYAICGSDDAMPGLRETSLDAELQEEILEGGAERVPT